MLDVGTSFIMLVMKAIAWLCTHRVARHIHRQTVPHFSPMRLVMSRLSSRSTMMQTIRTSSPALWAVAGIIADLLPAKCR